MARGESLMGDHHTISFATQEYVSRQHGDARIDCYVTEPERGITADTGFMLLIHGWGNDGQVSYEGESSAFANDFVFCPTSRWRMMHRFGS